MGRGGRTRCALFFCRRILGRGGGPSTGTGGISFSFVVLLLVFCLRLTYAVLEKMRPLASFGSYTLPAHTHPDHHSRRQPVAVEAQFFFFQFNLGGSPALSISCEEVPRSQNCQRVRGWFGSVPVWFDASWFAIGSRLSSVRFVRFSSFKSLALFRFGFFWFCSLCCPVVTPFSSA